MGMRDRHRQAVGRATISRSGRDRPRPDEVRDAVPARITRKELSENRSRPGWQKVLGVCLMAVGVALVIVNYGSEPNGSREALDILPGGHNLLYIPLGIGITVWGGWWTGAFDRK